MHQELKSIYILQLMSVSRLVMRKLSQMQPPMHVLKIYHRQPLKVLQQQGAAKQSISTTKPRSFKWLQR